MISCLKAPTCQAQQLRLPRGIFHRFGTIATRLSLQLPGSSRQRTVAKSRSCSPAAAFVLDLALVTPSHLPGKIAILDRVEKCLLVSTRARTRTHTHKHTNTHTHTHTHTRAHTQTRTHTRYRCDLACKLSDRSPRPRASAGVSGRVSQTSHTSARRLPSRKSRRTQANVSPRTWFS
jgi:hypothetical protein